MQLQFTAVFEKVSQGYIGFVEELPGANTQGETLEEARSNLAEAVDPAAQDREAAVYGGSLMRSEFPPRPRDTA